MTRSIVYTRTGDNGTTSLVGGERADKDSVRLEAYGTIDELNSHIGVVMACRGVDGRQLETLTFVQHRLFNIGGYLACDPNGSYILPPGVDEADIAALEREIDHTDSQLPKVQRFTLPSGSMAAAQCHVARSVCRRAERRILALSRTSAVAPVVLKFVNRLSDLLYVLARFNNVNQNIDELFWEKDCQL